MLTDLIQPRHLEWLGVVEWEEGLRRRLNLSNKYDNSEGLVLYAREKWCMGKWMFDAWLSGHEASCILEHAIRVKLRNTSGALRDPREEELIELVDAIIACERSMR